jgi:hypothetical protein
MRDQEQWQRIGDKNLSVHINTQPSRCRSVIDACIHMQIVQVHWYHIYLSLSPALSQVKLPEAEANSCLFLVPTHLMWYPCKYMYVWYSDDVLWLKYIYIYCIIHYVHVMTCIDVHLHVSVVALSKFKVLFIHLSLSLSLVIYRSDVCVCALIVLTISIVHHTRLWDSDGARCKVVGVNFQLNFTSTRSSSVAGLTECFHSQLHHTMWAFMRSKLK